MKEATIMGKKSRLKALRRNFPEQHIPVQHVPDQQPNQLQIKINLGNLDSIVTLSILLIVAISIFSLAFTILKPGFPSGHDITAHIVGSKILQEALAAGQFPVRWVEWAWSGASSPLFNFYQAGFYYFVALVNLVIPSHIESIKISVLLFWWLGAAFMFLFMYRFGKLPAALSALIFTFTPYIIADVFVRAAYPELGAITLSIGLLWVLDRLLISAKPIYGLPLALTLAGIIIFHLPTLVIITPVVLSYIILLFINQEVKMKGGFYVILSVGFGLGIASFYLLPALLELKYVKSQLLTSDYYDFHPHFVYPQQLLETKWGYGISQAGADDEMSFQFGIIQWLIITLTTIVLLIPKIFKITIDIKKGLIFWLLMILYAVFFMHDISLSFWENIKAISFIQYPWRFLMVVAIAASVLSGLLLAQLKKTTHQAGIIILSLGLIFVFYRTFLAPAVFVPKSDFDIVNNSIVEEGYMPKEVEIMPPKNILKWEIVKNPNDPSATTFDPKIKNIVEEKVIKDHYLSFTTQNHQPFFLRINSHFFPGWKVYIDNLQIKEDHTNPYGFIVISIPAGLHTVEVKFTNTPVRSLANAISILSLTGLIIWQIAFKGLTTSESL